MTKLIIASILLLTSSVCSASQKMFDCLSTKNKHPDIYSLACSMFQEAHTDGYEAAIATGLVVRNRMKNHKKFKNQDSYRKVVWHQRVRGVPQFSWTIKPSAKIPMDHFNQYLMLASIIDAGVLDGVMPEGVLWFHDKKIRTPWSDKLNTHSVIGSHRFFNRPTDTNLNQPIISARMKTIILRLGLKAI